MESRMWTPDADASGRRLLMPRRKRAHAMHDRFRPIIYPGPVLPAWATVLLYGLSILPWLIVPGLLVWAAVKWMALQQPRPEPAVELSAPSAAEMLRRRYVLGEIDAMTFEAMLERVLYSEAREASAQRSAALEGDYRPAPTGGLAPAVEAVQPAAHPETRQRPYMADAANEAYTPG
jgi:hypothetical protein